MRHVAKEKAKTLSGGSSMCECVLKKKKKEKSEKRERGEKQSGSPFKDEEGQMLNEAPQGLPMTREERV